jgi:hypothetical protein
MSTAVLSESGVHQTDGRGRSQLRYSQMLPRHLRWPEQADDLAFAVGIASEEAGPGLAHDLLNPRHHRVEQPDCGGPEPSAGRIEGNVPLSVSTDVGTRIEQAVRDQSI